MRLVGLFFTLCVSAPAEILPDVPPEKQVLLRMAQAMQAGKHDELKFKRYESGNYTYYLHNLDFLGSVTRGAETIYVAYAGFIRSSPEGRDTPPPSGYGHLVIFSPDFEVLSYVRTDLETPRLNVEKKLVDGETVLADFANPSISNRHRGFQVGPGDLPYPFSDRITDAQWESGDFTGSPGKGRK